jgi:hypothetical protein
MQNWHIWAVLAVSLISIGMVFLLPPIPQSEAYHNFADKRSLFGVPNYFNVASNLPFLLVGAFGIYDVLRFREGGATPQPVAAARNSVTLVSKPANFIDSGERWSYCAFFIGVAMTAFGSAYYHLDPRDGTLLWDRIPMAIGFMALVAATIGERISLKAGVQMLVPLMTLGAGSVVYWSLTQKDAHGDLRPYALVQFGSVLVVLLLVGLFPSRYTRGTDLAVALAIYGLAKIFEAADRSIFALGSIVSGHTVKHLAAATSAYWILRMLQRREMLTPKGA